MIPEPWQSRLLEEVSGLRDLGNPRGCLLSVHASRGAGKTHAAAAILARAIATKDFRVLLVAPTPLACRTILSLVNEFLLPTTSPAAIKLRPSEVALAFDNGARIDCVSERDRRWKPDQTPHLVVWDDAPTQEITLANSIVSAVMPSGGLIVAFARAHRLGFPPFNPPAPLLNFAIAPMATYRDLAREYQLYKTIQRP